MQVRGVDSVMIAVNDLETARLKWGRLYGVDATPARHVAEGDMLSSYVVPAGGSRIQLVQPVGETSTLRKFIDRRGEGLYALCIEVVGIEDAVESLQRDGVEVAPVGGLIDLAEMRELVLHPRGTDGVLTVLREFK